MGHRLYRPTILLKEGIRNRYDGQFQRYGITGDFVSSGFVDNVHNVAVGVLGDRLVSISILIDCSRRSLTMFKSGLQILLINTSLQTSQATMRGFDKRHCRS